MKIHGTLTPEDFFEARQMVARSQIMRFCGLLMIAGFPLISILSVHPHHLLVWIIATGAVCAALALLLLYFSPPGLIPRFVAERFKVAGEAPGLCEFEITAEGVALSPLKTSPHLNWKDRFRGYQLGRQLVVVSRNHTDYLILPRRWFTKEQYAEVQAYLQSALGNPDRTSNFRS